MHVQQVLPLSHAVCAACCRDPGNWATGLAGGAKFGYSLLFVILVSNILAMFLQHLALKLGVASGRDLAQACRDAYPRCAAGGACARALLQPRVIGSTLLSLRH